MATKVNEEKKKGWGWKKYVAVVIGVLVIVGIVMGVGAMNKGKTSGETAKIEKGRVSQDLVMTGTIKATEHAQLTFPAAGEMVWVGVKEGQSVKKGQALAQLDMVALKVAADQAQANLRQADATVWRVHDDVKGHDADETFTQKENRTTAEVARDKAYLATLAAQNALRNGVLRAPFAGLITHLESEFAGINIMPTTTIVEMVNPQSMYFELTADQTEVKDLKAGMQARIVLDTYPEEEFPAKIESIAYTPKESADGTVYEVKVVFESINLDKFRVGMTGDAKFAWEEKDGVLYVPPKFLGSDNKGRFLRVGDKNKKVYVEVGIQGEDRSEVSGEIKEGDVIYD